MMLYTIIIIALVIYIMKLLNIFGFLYNLSIRVKEKYNIGTERLKQAVKNNNKRKEIKSMYKERKPYKNDEI